jgi:hypothetical protein
LTARLAILKIFLNNPKEARTAFRKLKPDFKIKNSDVPLYKISECAAELKKFFQTLIGTSKTINKEISKTFECISISKKNEAKILNYDKVFKPIHIGKFYLMTKF